MADVPQIDAGEDTAPESMDVVQAQEGQVFRQYEAEQRYRDNINRDSDQRHGFRIYTVILSSLLVGIHLFILISFLINLREYVELKAPTALLLALIITPTVAATTLTAALLIAAFRERTETHETIFNSAVSEMFKAGGNLIKP